MSDSWKQQFGLTKKQLETVKKYSQGCWYVERFIKISLIENRKARKFANKSNLENL